MPDLSKDLQPTAQEDAPVIVDQRPQVVSEDRNQLNTQPQIVDGRVRVSDDISAQAEEQGYEPDIQPRAAVPAISVETGVGDSLGAQQVSTILPDTTAGQIQGLRNGGHDAEADAIVEKAAAASAALDVIQAPLSVQAEVAAQAVVDSGAPVDVPQGVVPVPDPAPVEPFPPSSAPDVTNPPQPETPAPGA